jgi:hypothetical protein
MLIEIIVVLGGDYSPHHHQDIITAMLLQLIH